MEEVLLFATVLAPILTVLVQLVKKTVNMPTNIVPAVSFALGIVLGAVAYPFTDLDLVLRLLSRRLCGSCCERSFRDRCEREGTTK
ncbi:holin [Bacillus paralicheniformis]|nr:holin [Bacillus paralicheniformis]QSF98151.1 holin [Bacillus paralicheniformis]